MHIGFITVGFTIIRQTSEHRRNLSKQMRHEDEANVACELNSEKQERKYSIYQIPFSQISLSGRKLVWRFPNEPPSVWTHPPPFCKHLCLTLWFCRDYKCAGIRVNGLVNEPQVSFADSCFRKLKPEPSCNFSTAEVCHCSQRVTNIK